MGRRSSNHTKSGKFMNPADQERKTLRKKELKRNRKQRVAVRHAILKSKDPDEILEQLEKLDRCEFEGGPESLKKNVLDEKRSKLKGTFYNVLTLYRNEKQEDKVKAMQIKMQQYEIARLQMEQNFQAVKFSVEADPGEIPLPDGFAATNAAMTPLMPSNIPAHLLLPEPRAGILKKPPPFAAPPPAAPYRPQAPPAAPVVRSQHPPGPPCGIPPPLSDSEEEDDDNGDDRHRHAGRSAAAPSSSSSDRKRVRFGEAEEQFEPDEDDYGPVDIPASIMAPPMPMGGVLHLAPPLNMPPMLPPPQMPPRVGIRVPPPPPYGKPRPMTAAPAGIPNPAAIISAEPVVNKRPAGGENPDSSAGTGLDDVTISAQPQLRDMRREATRFVPTTLRVNRPAPPPAPGVKRPMTGGRAAARGPTSGPQAAGGAKSTDDAYADFMKEMSSLL